LGDDIWADNPAGLWQGEVTVLALLFTLPRSEPIYDLDAHGHYLDLRSGAGWDLLWPGYYRSERSVGFESECGADPVGSGFAANWYFNAQEFNTLRETIERKSQGRWAYSGNSDLVLVNAWIPLRGEPTNDWESTAAGEVRADRTLSIGAVVERLSQDLEGAHSDASHGVGPVVEHLPAVPTRSGATRDFTTSVVAEIAASLGLRAIGL